MIVFVIVLVVVICLVLGIAKFGFDLACKPLPRRDTDTPVIPTGPGYDPHHDKIKEMSDAMYSRPYEGVHVTSFDGLDLFGRYYHVSSDVKIIELQCHGYKGSCFIDFCGGNKMMTELGWNMLSIDERSHGKSEGKAITFGINERRDVLTWINYINERFGDDMQIILSGVSMGAATVLMATDLELPKNVVGIVADCPYSSPKEIICKVGKDMGFPPTLMYPFVKLGAKLFGGFDLDESRATDAVAKTNIPILLIHGEDDGFVPCDMSRKIKEANEERIELHTFPGADHGTSYMVDMPRYTEVCLKFFERVLR